MTELQALENCLMRCTEPEVARKLRERIDYIKTRDISEGAEKEEAEIIELTK